MKRFLLSMLVLMCTGGIAHAQITQEELDRAVAEVEAATMNKKEKDKALRALTDSVMFQNALYALDHREFVLEAEKITFKRGRWRYVTPHTNFISLDGDRAVVQIAFEGAPPGPNGIGGITVEGRVTNLKERTDKKGNRYLTMNVMGSSISATVEIQLPAKGNRATANVSPTFSSNRFTLSGDLYHTSEARIFKGRTRF
ncbi:MAG: DUF4251 domain-containing protein [Tannerellaceae bacterium]|nr:DUF4251 domain-containing protein [Tannerellaceae bacterium]